MQSSPTPRRRRGWPTWLNMEINVVKFAGIKAE
jgi:hypothetical protein